MRKIFATSALALTTLALGPVVAQDAPSLPGAPDPARVQFGTYAVDPAHTQVAFTVNHLGFSNYVGLFGTPKGSLTIDPKQPEKASLSIEIPMDEVRTSSTDLDKHLKTPDFLDTAKFPTAKFVSTSVTVDGTTADIAGNLTLHGVTKPVMIEAQFVGAGPHPMNKKLNIGFSGTTTIKRSDFGITKFIPLVSDEVKLAITVAFEK
ncbi:YceI family protein [Rhizorhapis suberifaciens]|uniref:Polyisoprenoid-binding protein YceI n=1 Tax=Rhizorhapis suberifaciens TaxID=13656 RepID=A0A840HV43_9SPHN|nr:YceI family protein [Rhizorhapis suberifaciens]MBB4641925.1 polyisoprenoid-binding protein YceI [Rhizorhapis suberifaciens]